MCVRSQRTDRWEVNNAKVKRGEAELPHYSNNTATAKTSIVLNPSVFKHLWHDSAANTATCPLCCHLLLHILTQRHGFYQASFLLILIVKLCYSYTQLMNTSTLCCCRWKTKPYKRFVLLITNTLTESGKGALHQLYMWKLVLLKNRSFPLSGENTSWKTKPRCIMGNVVLQLSKP